MNNMSIQGHQWLKSLTFITSLLLIVCHAHFNSIGYAMLKMYSNILIWMHMGISLTYIILMLFKIQADKTDEWIYSQICKVKKQDWRLLVLQSFHTVVVVSIFSTLHGSSVCNSLQIKVLFICYLSLYDSTGKEIDCWCDEFTWRNNRIAALRAFSTKYFTNHYMRKSLVLGFLNNYIYSGTFNRFDH